MAISKEVFDLKAQSKRQITFINIEKMIDVYLQEGIKSIFIQDENIVSMIKDYEKELIDRYAKVGWEITVTYQSNNTMYIDLK